MWQFIHKNLTEKSHSSQSPSAQFLQIQFLVSSKKPLIFSPFDAIRVAQDWIAEATGPRLITSGLESHRSISSLCETDEKYLQELEIKEAIWLSSWLKNSRISEEVLLNISAVNPCAK